MSYWLFRLAATLTPLLPPRLGYWLFALFGEVAFHAFPKARMQYLKNLSRVVRRSADDPYLSSIALAGFRNMAKNYYDLFSANSLEPERIKSQLAELSGFEHLQSAFSNGKGVIGASAHFGNFNLFIQLAAVYLKDKYAIVVPTEKLEPEQFYEYIKALRARAGIELVTVDTASRTLIRTLKSGGLIGLALDYDVTHNGSLVDFFGLPARLPNGAVALSLRYGFPVVFAFIRRLNDNRSAVTIEPPITFTPTGDWESDILKGQQQIAGVMEKWIALYPEQWLMLQPIWEEDKQIGQANL